VGDGLGEGVGDMTALRASFAEMFIHVPPGRLP